MEELGKLKQRLGNSFGASTSSPQRILLTILLSLATFALLGFSTDIPWHLQTLSAGLDNIYEVFLNGLTGLYLGGSISLVLTVIYSVLSGIALTSMGITIFNGSISGKGVGGILPGFIATGCASCGVGVAGILGLTGFAATLPFGGDLFRIAGIVILTFALYEIGDPEVCEI